jgi:hypothetical protein
VRRDTERLRTLFSVIALPPSFSDPTPWREEILKRFPPIEGVEKPKRAYSNLIHGITAMNVQIPSEGLSFQFSALVHLGRVVYPGRQFASWTRVRGEPKRFAEYLLPILAELRG